MLPDMRICETDCSTVTKVEKKKPVMRLHFKIKGARVPLTSLVELQKRNKNNNFMHNANTPAAAMLLMFFYKSAKMSTRQAIGTNLHIREDLKRKHELA